MSLYDLMQRCDLIQSDLIFSLLTEEEARPQ